MSSPKIYIFFIIH